MDKTKLLPNALFQADCLALLERIDNEQVTLIYLDSPWHTGKDLIPSDEYLTWVAKVIQQSYRIAKKIGSIVIHTEPQIHSYFRLILAESFSDIEFSEIILKRPKHNNISYSKPVDGHKTLLVCRKSHTSVWNAPTRPLPENEIKNRYSQDDSFGRYALTDLTISKGHKAMRYAWRDFLPPEGRSWKFSKQMMEQLDAEDRIFYNPSANQPLLKRYAKEATEVLIGNVWDDIPYLLPRTERIKSDVFHMAQQPLALMERIITATTNEGSVLVDPFCGSGTMLISASNLNRQWLASDNLYDAFKITRERLHKHGIEDYTFGTQSELEQYEVVASSPLLPQIRFVENLQARFILNKPMPIEETRHYEFKEVKGNNPDSSISKVANEYAVAFLNSEGGRIYWGVRNEDRIIVGVKLEYRQRDDVSKKIEDKLLQIQPSIAPTSWRINFHQVYDDNNSIEDLFVVELIVPRASRPDILYAAGNNEVFVKTDSGRKKLSHTEILKEVRKRQISTL